MLNGKLEQYEDMTTLANDIRGTCHSLAGVAEELLVEREKTHSLAVQNRRMQDEIVVLRGRSSQGNTVALSEEEEICTTSHNRENLHHVSYAPSHTSPAARGTLTLRSFSEPASPSTRSRTISVSAGPGGAESMPMSARSNTRSYSERGGGAGGQRPAHSERGTGLFVGASAVGGLSLSSSPRKRPAPILATTSPKANAGARLCFLCES